MDLETVKKLNILMGELREGKISNEDFAILDNLVATDREVCQFYVDYVMVWADLYGFQAASCPELSLDNMGVIKLSGTRLLEALAEREDAAEAIEEQKETPIEAVPVPKKPKLNINLYKLHRLKFMAAVACLILFFSIFIYDSYYRSYTDIATITELAGLEQDSQGNPISLGTHFFPDDILTIKQGIVKLFINNGVELVIEGPATVTFKSEKELHLEKGNLYANVSKSAIGFTVNTPFSRIVDMGTEFGVGVNVARSIRTEVYKGLVELSTNASSANSKKVTLKVGQAGEISSVGKIICSDFSLDDRMYIRDVREFESGRALLNTNLIVNGDFEHDKVVYAKGISDTTKLSQNNIALYGWQDTGPATVNTYDTWGTGGDNAFTEMEICIVPENKGNNFYVAHGISNVYQEISVSDLDWKINRSTVAYNFSAWMGGWADQNDSLVIQLDFVDKDDKVLSTAMIVPATPQERNNIPGFRKEFSSGTVPAGTDKIKISLITSEFDGNTADAYVDNMVLILK